LLSDEQAQFVDLGPDFSAARANPERKVRQPVRQHVRELQALGYTLTLTLNPAA
jgi:transposase